MADNNNLRFDGRVVIVTGAGGGLGRSHALAFGARGASVVVNDLGASHTGEGASSRAADVVVEEIRAAGGKAVANYDSVLDGEKIVETAMKAFGRVDIVINNAGILKDVSFARMTDQQWDLIFQVHVDGAYKVLKAAWPIFRKQKFGRIINTTSAAGLYGNFGQANYSAAKLALVGLTQTLALEGKRDNIHCNVIAPMAASRMTETVLPPDMLASLKPEMVTPLVEYLCHEDTTETGSIFEVGAGFVGKLRWERTGGHGFPIDKTLLPEQVAEKWAKITDFEDGRTTHPTSTAESMEGIMANFENVGEASSERPKVVSADGKVDVEAAKSLEFTSEVFEYTERDVILYNLGIGAKRTDLHLVYENNENFGAVPTFGVVPSFTAMNAVPFGDILPSFNPMMLLHGEQYLEIIRPFPTSGKLTSTPYVVDILDKGKGCVVTIGVKTADEEGNDICVNEFTMFIRGSGGFGGKKDGTDRGAATAANQLPARKPDFVVQEKTSEDQAALYRLSGDWNPLHIDPEMAAVGGFDVPILHGLCSFGIAGKHIFNTYCNNDATQFKNIKVRFAKTVNPGETLETSMWREGNKVLFQVRAVERDAIVISNAAVELQGEALKNAPAKSKL
ncbi:MaoC like domain protein [Linnemannia elongata]|uniref:NAD(P)-binding protein n=1 Tax=Linnemannia elongata AG-77 TaxID=1314771 RepID=A0A197JP86_9FUNG|nr:MaoC like domain protein [Linnemannia elongata]OAQ27062.1 NAD(P)-binding protein [Linnemannia elongata AG-77]